MPLPSTSSSSASTSPLAFHTSALSDYATTSSAIKPLTSSSPRNSSGLHLPPTTTRSRASSRDSQSSANGPSQYSRLNTPPQSSASYSFAPSVASSSVPKVGLGSPPRWVQDFSPSADQADVARTIVSTSFEDRSSSTSPSTANSASTAPHGLAPPIFLSLTTPSTSNTPLASPSSASSSSSGFRVLSRPNRTTGPPPIGDPNKARSQPNSRGSTTPASRSSSYTVSPIDSHTPLPAGSGIMSPLTMNASASTPTPSVSPSPPSSSRQSSKDNTPRRPSLLTQQILSSPAIPLATTLNSQANDQAHSFTPGSMGPPMVPGAEGAEGHRLNGLKDILLGHHPNTQNSVKGKQAEGWSNGSTATSGLRLDTSVGGLSAGLGSTMAGVALPVGTSMLNQPGTPQGVTRKGSLHRGRSYNMGSASGSSSGEGWRTPASGGSSGHQAPMRGAPLGSGSSVPGNSSGDNAIGWKSPTEMDEDDVIETADLMFGKDQNTGRKMINQYLILQEIGRGQHGQVRLGQDLSSPESSRSGSSMGIHSPLDSVTPMMSPSLSAAAHFSGDGLHAPSTVPNKFWAIKIVDRQPRKKLPGMRKLGGGASGVPEASVANEKLKREIAILKKCRHPNVVRLREVIDASISKKIYLILEYCEAGEVKWKSEDGRPLLTVAEARKVFRDVVCGLEYLHHQGIIHRDIKPANLLYSGDGLVKISDFGVSHYSHVPRGTKEEGAGSPEDDEPAFMDEHDLAKTAGSPAFFAPELCYNGDGTPSGSNTPSVHQSEFNLHSGSNIDSLNKRLSMLSGASSATALSGSPKVPHKKRPPITQAIDIWALGVTLYCFLFGRVPFDSTSEYALFGIIPVDDFAVPNTMGADQMWTGGRAGFKQGSHGALGEEACEVIDLLERLLTKDPTKRITLEAVKRHPFTLRDITDKPAWLASTDIKTESHVTVSNDEVAAAVTTSGFFKSMKRSVKHLSNKLNIFSSTGSKTRSRSQSIVGGNSAGISEFGQMMGHPDSQTNSASGTLTQVPSPIVRSAARLPCSGNQSANSSVSRLASPDTGSLGDGPSPRPGGTPQVARRLSWLMSNSSKPAIDRTRSPVAGQPAMGLSDLYVVPPSSSAGSDALGRSISDRSAGSSSGMASSGPLRPARRQSTHLMPPRQGSPMSVDRSLSISASAEALDQMIANALVVEQGMPLSARAVRLRNKQSADMDASAHLIAEGNMGRPRSESTTSSSGLQRIARLFSRNQSHKSNSTSGSNVSTGRRSQERLMDINKVHMERNVDQQRSPDLELASADALSATSADGLRHRKSGETLASSLHYASSRADLSSPELSKTTLPPLGITDWDGRQAFGMSPDRDRPTLTRNSTEVPTRSIEAPDWNGNLSDDDDDEEEDYGREAVSAFDRVPNSIDDLRTGSWKLDSRGWRGQSAEIGQLGPEESLGLSLHPSSSGGPAFGRTINLSDSLEGDTAQADSPATLMGPTRAWSNSESPKLSPVSPSFDSKPEFSPPPSPVDALHGESRNRSMSRNSIRGFPLRLPGDRIGPDRAKSPLGRMPLELAAVSARFMDAREGGEDGDEAEDEEEEEEDGLAMDFGKRGRRFSKATMGSPTSMRRKVSLG